MNRLVNLWVKAVATELELCDPVVEIGSFQVAGQEDIADLRAYFPGFNYLGTDMREGPGVDRVEDVHQLSFPDAEIGTLLLMETLEHVADPARALSEVRRVLSASGVLIVSTPFALGIHNHPNDFWRFTPEAYHLLLDAFAARLVGSIGPENDPLFVLGVAFGEKHHAPDLESRCGKVVERYRALLRDDAVIARERRVARLQRRLSAALPLREARRAYRTRARSFDTRFGFCAGDKRHEFNGD